MISTDAVRIPVCAAFLITFVLFAAISTSVDGRDVKYTLVGAGGSLQSPLFLDLSGAFSLLNSDIVIEYEGITQKDGVTKMVNNSVDFVGSDYHVFTPQDFEKRPTLQLFPIFACNWGFSYNIPNLARSDPPLVLSRELLSEIFKGNVTQWNDPKIVALNPGLASKLPNATMIVGLRKDAALSTTTIGAGLLEIDPFWRSNFGESVVTTSLWPPAIQNLPNRVLVTANLGMLGFMTSTPYGFGYGPFPYLVQFPEIRHARVINKFDVVADPRDMVSLASVMNTYNLTAASNGMLLPEIIDPDLEHSWPYATFSYLGIDTDPNAGNCEKRSLFLKWIRWFLTAEDAAVIARRKGFVLLSGKHRDAILEKLNSWTCVGPDGVARAFLAQTEIPLRNSPAYYIVFGIEALLFLIGFGILFVYLKSIWGGHAIRSRLEIMFTIMFSISSALSLVSIILWLVPPSDAICQARVWVTALGGSTLLSSMFSRLFHLHRLYNSYTRSNTIAMEKLTARLPRTTALLIFSTLAVQIIILILWNAIHPLRQVDVVKDAINLKVEKSCAGGFVAGWLIIELVYSFLMLSFCIYTIYLVWSIKASAVETRGLLIMTYNIVLIMCVITPIVAVQQLRDDDLFFLVSVCLTFCVCASDYVLFWRKLVLAHNSQKGSSQKSNSPPTANLSATKSASNGSRLDLIPNASPRL